MRASVFILFVSLVLAVNIGFSVEGKRFDFKKHRNVDKLRKNFYRRRCPQLEEIVETIIESKVKADPTMAPKLLRLHYHDCFVRGCDASILIDPVGGDNSTEKNAGPNRSIAGYEVIDEIKTKVEEECPDIVSCADIVAIAARDAVSTLRGQRLWEVRTGRRDGRVTLASEASRDLPSGGSNYTTLQQLFARFGLNDFDLVALSGAHTIGVTHCGVISRRLFNFTGKGDADPSLDPEYAKILKNKCSPPPNPATTVDLDRDSALSFDSHYYAALNQKQGILVSDAALLTNNGASVLTKRFQNFLIFKRFFGQSMMNMGAVGVLTGNKGEIRKNCRVINP
ncbi:hypothetical protein UlMin_009482 [Ulmus minor]